MAEQQPVRHWEHQHLLFRLGYYSLILDRANLSEEWQKLYQERLAETQVEIERFDA